MPKFLDDITPTIECSITKWHSWTSSSGSFDPIYGPQTIPVEYYFYFPHLYNRYNATISNSVCCGKAVFAVTGSSGLEVIKEELLFSGASIKNPNFTITRTGSSSYTASVSGTYMGEACGSGTVTISYLKISHDVINSNY